MIAETMRARIPRGLLNDFVRGLKQSDLHSSRHRCPYG